MNVKQIFKEIDDLWVSTFDIGEMYYVISFMFFVFGIITWGIITIKEIIK